MCMIVDNQLAQDKLDAQIGALNAEVRMLKWRRNALSPISQLPPEVLRAIYAQVEECDPKKLPPPVILSHVCRSWRELVVSFPRLWTDIRIRNGTSPSLLDLMLKNSRKLPIQVSFESESEQDSPILLAIQKVLSAPDRLQSLDLSCNEQAMKTCLLHALGRAESLEFLRIQGDEWDPVPFPVDFLSGGTPNLRHIELKDCDVLWDSPLFLQSPRLTHLILLDDDFKIEVSPWQLCRVLRETPQLEVLTFKLLVSTYHHNVEGDMAPAPLPNLRSLLIYGELDGLCKFFRGIRIPMSISVLDIIIRETEEIPDIVDQSLIALKAAFGNPNPKDFFSPRQIQLYKYPDDFEYDEIQTRTAIKSWREFPTSTTGALNLIHSPRGPASRTFSIRTLDLHSIDKLLLPFIQWQARTGFWTLADLRYLEMNVFEGQSSAWKMFAQLPKLEEVIVGPGSSFGEFIKNLSGPVEYKPGSDSSLQLREQDSGAAAPCFSLPFPALRAIVFRTAYCDYPLLLTVLYWRQCLGARLRYLEFEGSPAPPLGMSQAMASIATNVVWKVAN